MSGIIYKAMCITNKKIYIGQTVQKLKTRRRNHLNSAFNPKSSPYNTYFSRAIRKYGKNNFEWDIIYDNIPINYLDIMEIWIISVYDSHNNGYNSTEGGKAIRGYKHSNETKKKISEGHKGEKSHMYGKHLSKETKQKISEALVGEKNHMYGKTHTKEVKQKMSKIRIGRKHTKETKQKISKAHRGLMSGEKSPNAKLTWKKAKEIRQKYATKEFTQDLLAKEYGVSRAIISRIIHNKIWIEENQDKGNKTQ